MLVPLCVIVAITSICDKGLREVKEFYENVKDTSNIFVFRYCSDRKRGHFKYAIYKEYNLNDKPKDEIEILETNSTINLNKPPFQFNKNILQRIASKDTNIPQMEKSEMFTQLKTSSWPEIINFNNIKDLHKKNNLSKTFFKNDKNVIFFENVEQMKYFDTKEFDIAMTISQKNCMLSWSSSIPIYKQLLQNFNYPNWIFLTALLLLSVFFGELIKDYDWNTRDYNFVDCRTKRSSRRLWRLKVLMWIEIIFRQPIRFPSNIGSPQKVFMGSLFIFSATFYESFQVNLMTKCIKKSFINTEESQKNFIKPCERGYSRLDGFSNTLSENCKLEESMSTYIFPKYSPYFEVFNQHLHLINTAGLENQWFSDSCFKTKLRYSLIMRNEERNLEDLPALIIILCTGLMIACITLVIEILYSKYA